MQERGRAAHQNANRQPPEHCVHIDDIEIDYESLREAGAMMGSGGLVVMDQDTCMVDVAKYFLKFLQEESCGKCVPCRIGSEKITEMGTRLLAGEVSLEEFDTYEPIAMQLSSVMQATSICGLGQVASHPLQSFLKFFPDLARDACRNR